MESLWKLLYLLEPAPVTLIVTAVAVKFGSAFRALNHGKEMERNGDLLEAPITLDMSQALMIPVMSSCSLLLMFYLFSSVSQLLTAFTAIASVSSLFFWLSPHVAYLKSQFGFADPFLSQCCSKSFTRIQGLLLLACIFIVATWLTIIYTLPTLLEQHWLVSGHWILNNFLGISLCVAFVSHVRLPNIKICAMFLVCLFVFFGANVMVSVATKQASNPVHMVANKLPVKIVFPRNLWGGASPAGNTADFMILGLGDMAILAMLLALVLCFDYRNSSDTVNLLDLHSLKGNNYIWYALPGYAIGLVTALTAGILTHSPQPALLYQVPSTLGPIFFISWLRKDLAELWEGTMPNLNDKSRQIEL
ncbi:hypothetical protein V6Z11_A11G008700 [Gossypium hirsutum]